jgi:hypothetical protein
LLYITIINAFPAWLYLKWVFKYKKAYEDCITSEVSGTQKRACHLRYMLSVVAWIALFIAAVYFFPIIRCEENGIPFYYKK